MEFTGRIIAIMQARSGISKASGNSWMTQEYVIEETQGQYPKRMCFEVFGEDKIRELALAVNREVTVSFDIHAREYQGRWYNTIRAWKVENVQAQGGIPQAAAVQAAPKAQAAPQQAQIAFTPEQQQKVDALKNAFEAEEQNPDDPNLPF